MTAKPSFESECKVTLGAHPNDAGGQHTNGPEFRDVTVTHLPTGASITLTADICRSPHKARMAATDGLHFALLQMGAVP